MSRQHTFPRSSVVVLGANSISSLVPSTLISQVESLLDSHRIQDAVDLVDQRRRKLEGTGAVPDEDEADELRYVYQRIGFQCFTETLFEDAGKNLFNGELDPRLLVSYYPELRGSLFSADASIDVFAGVAECMPTEASVDDIILTNIARNYSPHLSPNTRSAPPTAELRKILNMAAEDMLELFLRKWRVRKQLSENNGSSSSKPGGMGSPVDKVVDTILVKLYAKNERTVDLYALLSEQHSIVLDEVESVLQSSGQYNALCTLYKQRGEDLKLLDIWSKLVEGKWTDTDIKDPLSSMVTLLSEKKDREMTKKWGLWLVKMDPEKGLKLLMPKDTGKRREKPEEDLALLEEIESANPTAGREYLEWLVLQRRSSSAELHNRLANSLLSELLLSLQNDVASKLWRAKASSYASTSTTTTPFLSYLASTTPDSAHKKTRLKTILFLAGSGVYDPIPMMERLKEQEGKGKGKVLELEFAILDGKLGNHQSALSHLVHGLRDAASAESYCALGGEVVSPKVAQGVMENSGLQGWAGGLFGLGGGKGSGGVKGTGASLRQVDDVLRKELLRILLEVYMKDAELSSDRAAKLLDSQAVNLDLVDVLQLVPSAWPLQSMASFLARSFRRTLHAKQEGKIMKNISAGQNLEVRDSTWTILRDEGAIVEEEEVEDEKDYDEKGSLAEKVALHLSAQEQASDGAEDVPPPPPPPKNIPRDEVIDRETEEDETGEGDLR